MMSIAARGLFLSLNCIGTNAKLKIRLRVNGMAMIRARSPMSVLYKTDPKVIAIRI